MRIIGPLQAVFIPLGT